MFLAVSACHDAIVLPYAAYLRVYEPLSAFHEAGDRDWAAYAASESRPRRAGALVAEQGESVRRMTALPSILAPRQESEDAYVRWSDGQTYICPWQSRLRSWLAVARLRATRPQLLAAAYPAGQAEAAVQDFARWQGQASSLRVYIQASTWTVPLAWFVPFAPGERWLVLGSPAEPDQPDRGPATAAGTRTLVYSTAMSTARQRVARAIGAVRRAQGEPASGPVGAAARDVPQAGAELDEIGRWLEEFHPHALVELDYGGLVHLLDDDALRGDLSVAEVSGAVSAMARGEYELAIAMYERLQRRWRGLAALERAS